MLFSCYYHEDYIIFSIGLQARLQVLDQEARAKAVNMSGFMRSSCDKAAWPMHVYNLHTCEMPGEICDTLLTIDILRDLAYTALP